MTFVGDPFLHAHPLPEADKRGANFKLNLSLSESDRIRFELKVCWGPIFAWTLPPQKQTGKRERVRGWGGGRQQQGLEK